MRRRKAKKPLEVGELLVLALADAGLSEQARRLQIFQGWERVVGNRIAACTAPEMFRRGVLLVRAKSPTWQNELTFLKADIITKMNAFLGQDMVKDIKVVSGHFAAREKMPPEKPLLRPKNAADTSLAERTAADGIDDPEVRKSFVELMEKHLRRIR